MDIAASPSPAPPRRIVSLDALRGFDMCWILGLDAVVITLMQAAGLPGREMVAGQLEHVAWAGFHFEDLIFPLFLFIAGVSLSISLPRRVASDGRGATARHLVFRALVLFVLGIIYSGGMQKGIDQVRWLGVLQRIALGSCFAGLLSLVLPTRGLVVAAAGLLAAYWALLTFVPVPGSGAGNYAEGMNLSNYLDRTYLPGRKYDGDHDPEGILSTLTAVATGIIGILAGRWLTGQASPMRKVGGFIMAGLIMLAAGWLWHLQFPVIKKLWTSSFVIVAGGWSMILLAVFYWLVDVRGWKWWTTPFVWVGANPITLYLCEGIGLFPIITRRIAGVPPSSPPWLTALVSFSLVLLLARFLYRRGIFLRV